jgi:hypothetical protein
MLPRTFVNISRAVDKIVRTPQPFIRRAREFSRHSVARRLHFPGMLALSDARVADLSKFLMRLM